MGCWNETCMMTNLPIQYGDKIVAFLIAKRPGFGNMSYSDGVFAPLTLPVYGEYNDYGSIESFSTCNGMFDLLWDIPFCSERGFDTRCLLWDDEKRGMTEKTLNDTIEKLFGLAMQGELRVDFKNQVDGSKERAEVYPAFIRKEFFDFAVKAMKSMEEYREIIDERLDMSAGVLKFMPTMKDHVRKGQIAKEEIWPVMALNQFMDAQRIAWHPTCGTGSQNLFYNKFQSEFYALMNRTAKRIKKESEGV